MRPPMNDHQFALAAREHLAQATNEDSYDVLVSMCNAVREVDSREAAVAVRETEVTAREAAVTAREAAAPAQ